MKWAITPRGIGRPVGYRAIGDNWPLAEGETFTLPEGAAFDGMVLAEDGISLRPGAQSELIDLAAYAAQKRWEKETGGLVHNGWPVKTDRESQSLIAAEKADIATRPDPDWFKFADGRLRQLSNLQFVALANLVRNHIRKYRAIEAKVAADIQAGTITTTEQIDAAFAV